MQRRPEQELMTDPAQALAYASSDFTEPHNAFVRRFRERFPDFYKGNVADLGCGTADVTIRMARAYPQAYFVGMDGADAMLELGQNAVWEAGLALNILLRNAFLPNHGFNHHFFDAVISNSTLHQMHEPQGLWQTVRELAKPNSPIFVMDLTRPPTEEDAQALVEAHAQGAPEAMREDFFNSLLAAFRPEEVVGQLELAGLSRLRVEVVSNRHMVIYGRG